jgi:predicted DNA-binding transcriptional regulator YafY
MKGYKPPKPPKLPPMPSEKEEQYRRIIGEAIISGHPIEFTYATDKHESLRVAIPCKVGTLNNQRLAVEGYNPQWTTPTGRPQQFKLFNLRDMDRLQVQEDKTFNSMAIPYPYTPSDSRFDRVDYAV